MTILSVQCNKILNINIHLGIYRLLFVNVHIFLHKHVEDNVILSYNGFLGYNHYHLLAGP